MISGAFDPEYREYLRPFLAHPSVEVIGFSDDVQALMQGSDVLILPSIEEGSALVTYEAQACGCALLVSDASGARCEDGRQGFVHAAGDFETLTKQLRILWKEPHVLASMRAQALASAAKLTWGHAGGQLRGIYELVKT